MGEPSTFDDAWLTIESAFERLAADVKELNALAWSYIGRYSTEIFPFTGYISFNRAGIAGSEDFVLMMALQHSDGRFIWTHDLTATDDAIWVDGEDIEFDDTRALETWLPEVMAEALRFLKKHQEFIMTEIGTPSQRLTT